MKLSIIIPVYNVKSFLPEAVESVLAQSFRDFELILVDDGATDGSGEICDRYAGEDSRIKVIHQKNAGVSAARNAGVSAAQGEYIGFTDSDDIIERDMYQRMMALAQQYDAEVVQCEHDRASTLNGAVRSDEVTLMDGEAFVRRIFTKQSGRYTNQVALWSKIYRRELFDGIVFPVGRTYEDEQETYKLCLKAKTIVETTDVLYHYIKRENSIITGISAKKMLDKQAALLDRLYYLPERIPDLKRQCAASFWSYSKGILCQMYQAGEKEAVKKGMAVLLREKKQCKCAMTKSDRFYLPLLRLVPGWILKNDFVPIQKMLGRVRN